MLPLRQGASLPQGGEFKYLGGLFTSEGEIEQEMDQQISRSHPQ